LALAAASGARGEPRQGAESGAEGDALLFSGGADGFVRVWDVRTMRCLRTLAEHRAAVRAPPPPPPGTKRTRRVSSPVQSGHAASLPPY
jgi:WD40 repeat protein